MAITDIQISEELETSAPSIKYRGDEGPKSPEEEQMMMAGPDRYFKILEFMLNELEGELGRELTDEEYEEVGRRAMDEFQQSRGPVLPEDPTKPVNPFGPKPEGPVLPDRQMAAYGGIMGMDGRKRYGLGSIKDRLRKLIPNEIAKVAEVAAPFVAPFNPLAAGLMSGIGGFDRTGRIGSSLKSGLMNYGLGQVARGIGGGMDNLQRMSFRTPQGSFFSSPIQDTGGLGEILKTRKVANAENLRRAAMTDNNPGFGNQNKNFLEKTISKIGEFVPTSFSDLKDPKKILGALGIYQVGKELLGGPEEVVSEIMDRGEGLDIQGIRAEVTEAFKDPSGKKLAALRTKYPYLGTQASKNTAIMANGGRIGFSNGGLTEYEAYRLKNMGYDTKGGTVLEPFGGIRVLKEILRVNKANGGRMGMQEGGIMDLGGMEKDYRNTGGFVDIGEYEKKDDVPARLSVNEFVMTADAVRGMGDGDIDLGAKRMENLMSSMENKKGAQQMFDVSERLSEVV